MQAICSHIFGIHQGITIKGSSRSTRGTLVRRNLRISSHQNREKFQPDAADHHKVKIRIFISSRIIGIEYADFATESDLPDVSNSVRQ
jgi:hypothetical protein